MMMMMMMMMMMILMPKPISRPPFHAALEFQVYSGLERWGGEQPSRWFAIKTSRFWLFLLQAEGSEDGVMCGLCKNYLNM